MSKIGKIQQNTHDIIIATVNEEGKVADSMADPKVCVALDGTTVEEMTDEAGKTFMQQGWVTIEETGDWQRPQAPALPSRK